jgi:hypothetical protein
MTWRTVFFAAVALLGLVACDGDEQEPLDDSGAG